MGVFANKRSILHKGDGTTHVSAPPDVCKVPTPAGPVPTPFVNTAQDSMLAKGSKTVKIEGNSIALASSELSTSSGDEPGTAGGIISSKFKGKLTWSGSSTDVKVEGKGVVRFLDPTLHNGNTSNVFFASNGRTDLAYGDDTTCTMPSCDKSLEKHRVHETHEARDCVEKVFLKLADVLKEQDQEQLIDEYLKYDGECLTKREDVEKLNKEETAEFERWKKPIDDDIKTLQGQIKQAQDKVAIGEKINQLKGQIAFRKELLTSAKKQRNMELEAFVAERDPRMKEINREIERIGPVLAPDPSSATYIRGYMIGACICKCPQNPKKLVACSGTASPGFQKAADAAGFTRVEGYEPTERQKAWLDDNRPGGKWECAAPQLLDAGKAGGHKVGAISERWYSPKRRLKKDPATVEVTYERTDEQGTRKETKKFGHGQSVPSCDRCQVLIPEMLCENHQECG